MLAAKTARTILQHEHDELRRRVDEIGAIVERGKWRRAGRELDDLRGCIRALQVFDRAEHRPKGVMLFAALRGRSPALDGLVAAIEAERARDDAALASVLAALDALADGDASGVAQCGALLEHYRGRLLRQLDDEDSQLLEHAARLLTRQEWSAIASSISSVMYPARRNETRDRDIQQD